MFTASRVTAGALCAAGLSLASVSTAHAQFVPGDLYLISESLPDPVRPCGSFAVIRINPLTWQTSLLVRPSDGAGRGAYDPHRARIIITHLSGAPELIDSVGGRTPLPPLTTGSAVLVAPTTDGRIYAYANAATPFQYYDASNTVHTVMDATGATSFILSGDTRAIIYDDQTSSLFAAGTVTGDLTRITRIPISADGSRVAGPITSTTFDGSAGASQEVSVGFSYGPAGKLFLKLDDNTSGNAGRMRLINTQTLEVTVYASSGYFGAGGEIAGAYAPTVDRAIVVDSASDVLRVFEQGAVGAGSILPSTGVSSNCGAGEIAQLVVVRAGCRADFSGDGTVNSQDFFDFLSAFFSSAPRADFNADGSINSQDFFDFLAAFFAGC